ncbi:MAG: nicotinate (nicotinamide) nucleotide adenylyltransferase [Candidatus Sumerlaeia bacterium]|nr:nicotinate (nicotinamide) nucleotide adenylyltransferase [Candidatus Sumerlaeia bacterium]
MKIGIFGGTFDPPHLSHILACHYILETTDIEKIFVIPCYQHPFGKACVSFDHRLRMCQLAMQRLKPAVEVLDIEGKRGGISYTIDTVRELKSQYPEDEFILIAGSDILEETNKWKDFAELQKLVKFLILPRITDDTRTEKHTTLKFFLPDISSTMVRNKLRNGESVEELISRSVLAYIKQHNLYMQE